jgi:hypothetical protein
VITAKYGKNWKIFNHRTQRAQKRSAEELETIASAENDLIQLAGRLRRGVAVKAAGHQRGRICGMSAAVNRDYVSNDCPM